ncbi:ABC transporter C family member 10 [Camellia lanceoleosa]|uniref:ABC transporter C family member 10 n=1 Tax=Camellia lanceoleosa TaxID=1840588 RepID=A0ACC0H202_9ERIC|nr:ABC transporter C family member 10 [Camellia lanceoleosa]
MRLRDTIWIHCVSVLIRKYGRFLESVSLGERSGLRLDGTEFADCTVITVLHRIPTVMDCTMVLAISDGKLVEFDEPMKLMKRENSLFGQLVKKY